MTHKQEIFLQAYRPFHEALTKYCSALAYGKMDTEDLIQEVLLTTYEHFEGIRKKEQLLHYMIRAARNISIRQWRKEKNRSEFLAASIERLKFQDVSPEHLMDIQILYGALEKLPESQRDAVILFEITGMKVKEIAKMQDSSEAATKMRLTRGRQQLRKMLSEEEELSSLILLGFPFNPNYLPDLDCLFQSAQFISPEISLQQGQKLFVVGKASSALPFVGKGMSLLTGKLAGSLVTFTMLVCLGGLISSDRRESSRQLSPFKRLNLSELSSLIPPVDLKPKALNPIPIKTPKSASSELTSPQLPSQEGAVEPNPSDTPDSLVGVVPLDTLQALEGSLYQPSVSLIPPVESIDTSLPALPIHPQMPMLVRSQDPCDPDWRFDGNISTLKRKLLDKLRKDGLIPAKQGKARLKVHPKGLNAGLLIYFSSHSLLNKEKPIPENLLPTYKAFFQEFDIPLCPSMLIESTPQYIAVGRRSKDGFHGRMDGRATIDNIGK